MHRSAGHDTAPPLTSGLWGKGRAVTIRTRERVLWLSLTFTLILYALHAPPQPAREASTAGPGQEMSSSRHGLSSQVKLLAAKAPTSTYKHNLLRDRTYFTAFHYGGFTNQLIEHIKLVYFSKETDRIAIIPDLFASHKEGSEPPFSDYFDLPRWSALTGAPIIEWRDVKQPLTPKSEPPVEQLACWGEPGEWGLTDFLPAYNIKTTFWPVDPRYDTPRRSFTSLKLMLAQDQSAWLATQKPLGESLTTSPTRPNAQVACLGSTFGVQSLAFDPATGAPREDFFSLENLSAEDPLWTEVGQHLHFNEHVEREVDALLNSLLPAAQYPRGAGPLEFIGIHFRQGDFVKYDRITRDLVDDFAAKLARVQAQLAQRPGRATRSRTPLPVIVATDSKSRKFRDRLNALGWITVDHDALRTVDRLGGWWPGLLDSALLARATGFVGTGLSTFSYVAARRVETWQGGITDIVENLKK